MFAPTAQSFFYRHFFKPLAFKVEPEFVHDLVTSFGMRMGRSDVGRSFAQKLWHYEHPMLKQEFLGVTFHNPVGLTAGFDKDGLLTDILPHVGFGFAEIGSVTGEPCTGNAKPRLWRLPKTKSLIVYYGLKNDGCEVVAARLAGRKLTIPFGVSIAKTNSPKTCDGDKGIEDYVKAFRTVLPVSDYVTLNISCPNTYGGEPFTNVDILEQLLCAIDATSATKPVFIKMPVDLPLTKLEQLVDVIFRHRVQGLIFANLTKRHDLRLQFAHEKMPTQKGGLSGRPVYPLSNKLLRHFYPHVKEKLLLVGTGGIFSADDAYEKILCGASLVQLATGMIFEGPQLIGQINYGLVERLQRNGYTSISEAIGTYRPVDI